MKKLNLSLLLMFPLMSSQIFAQEADGMATCTEPMKLEALVKKGVMTKESCFKFIGNSLKLNITGRTYKLAEVNDANLSDLTATSNGKTVCTRSYEGGGHTSVDSEQDTMPKESLRRLGLFINGINDQIEKLKSKGIIQDNDKIQISSDGYADGVRVVGRYMDQMIFNEIGIKEYADVFIKYGVTATSFDDKQKLFSKIACPSNQQLDKKAGNYGLARGKEKNLLFDLRNVGIARRRANNLLNTVKKNIQASTQIQSSSTGFISPGLRTNDPNCKGYCALRRGAELRINIPGLSSYSLETKKEDTLISPIFNTPYKYDQIMMNQIAIQTLVRDFDNYIIKNLKSTDKVKKELATDIFQFLVNFHSIKGLGKEFIYFMNLKDLNSLKEKNIVVKTLNELMNIEFKDTDYETSSTKKHLLKSTAYYKFVKSYDKFVKVAGKKFIDNNTDKIYDLFVTFLKEKYALNDKDIKTYQDTVNWTFLSFFSGLKDTYKVDYWKTFNPKINPEEYAKKAAMATKPNSILTYKDYKKILIRSKINSGGTQAYVPGASGVFMPKTKYIEFVSSYLIKMYMAMKTKAPTNPKAKKNQNYDFQMPITELQEIIKKYFPDKDYKISDKNGSEVDPILVTSHLIGLDMLDHSMAIILGTKQYNSVSQAERFLKEIKTKLSEAEFAELSVIYTRLTLFVAKFRAESRPASSARAFDNYKFTMKKNITNSSEDASTVFSFLDYRDTFAAINNNIYNNDLTYNFQKKIGLRQAAKKIGNDMNVIGVYYKPNSIISRDTEAQTFFTGFFHNACETGVFFLHDPYKNTRFHYQTRMAGIRGNYQQYKNSNELYDQIHFLSEQPGKKLKYFNMLALKHPTAYLIPSCKSCGCLKKTPEGNNVTGDYLLSKLQDKNTIELNFNDGFEWRDDGKDKTQVGKKIYSSAYAIKEYNLEKLKALAAKKGGSISAKISSNYCLYAPTVPQSHNWGDGAAKDNGPDDTNTDKEFYCPVIDALAGLNDIKVNAKGEIDAAGAVLTEDQINEVINVCEQVVDNFPMNEKDCKDPSKNNKCIFVNQQLVDQFNINTQSKDPRCWASSDTVNYGTDGKFCVDVLLNY
jgi:hypothetical protein